MNYSYVPEADIFYLNVAASVTGASTDIGWVIQNAPLVSSFNSASGSREEVITLNLMDLGINEGADLSSIHFDYTITPLPTTSWTGPSILRFDDQVAPIMYRFASTDAPTTAPTGPGAPAGVKVGGEVKKKSEPRKFGSVEESENTCCAGAFARSVDWLDKEHELQIGLGAQKIYDELRKLGVSVDDPNKFDFPDWIKAKAVWANEQAMKKEQHLKTKVWDSGTILPIIVGVPEETGDFWKWLTKELDSGEDIEVAHLTATGAHIVTISDYLELTDGSLIVHYHDDQTQGATGGDGGKAKKVAITKSGGTYYFGSNTQPIYAAVSESVPEPGTLTLMALGFALLSVVSRKKAWFTHYDR